MRKSSKTVTERGQSEAPAALAKFIDLVNAEWPFDRELPDPFEAALEDVHRISQQPARVAYISPRDIYIDNCKKAAATLSAETRRFLGPATDLEAFWDKYPILRSAREVLFGIAERNRSESPPRELIIHDARYPGAAIRFSVNVNLVVNENGKSPFQGPPCLTLSRVFRQTVFAHAPFANGFSGHHGLTRNVAARGAGKPITNETAAKPDGNSTQRRN